MFQDNETNPYMFTQIINKLSIWYNNGKILVENNGEGSAVVHHLWYTFENENMYNAKGSLGLNANNKTKSKAIIIMKAFLEDKQLKLNDYNTVKQLATYIEDDKGNCHGQNKMPDDLISSLYWACYAFELDLFDEEASLINLNNSHDTDVWGILADIDPYSNSEYTWFA